MAETQLSPIPTFADGAEGGTPINAANLNILAGHVTSAEQGVTAALEASDVAITGKPAWMNSGSIDVVASRLGSHVTVRFDAGPVKSGQPSVETYDAVTLGRLPADMHPVLPGGKPALGVSLKDGASRVFMLRVSENGIIDIQARGGSDTTKELSSFAAAVDFDVTIDE